MVYILASWMIATSLSKKQLTIQFQYRAETLIMTIIAIRFIILLALIFILAPSAIAFSPYMPCRVACNTAYLSCMHVYGMSRMLLI